MVMKSLYKRAVIGLRRGIVSLEKHNLEWDNIAKNTIYKLSQILSNVAVDIQHIGSTAIKGIKAKPIIDIVIGVKNLSDIEDYKDALDKNGYIFRGEDVPAQILFVAGDFMKDTRTHHIHVVRYGEDVWNNYIDFRDYLNSNFEMADEYNKRKEKLAKMYPDNREAYTKGKKQMIDDILMKAKGNKD